MLVRVDSEAEPDGDPDGEPDGDPDRTLRALAHPLRLQLLSLLTGAVMSAAEAAREIGTTQANASYHLRQLEGAGLVEVAEEVSVRGGRARRFRHAPASGTRLGEGDEGDIRLVAAVLAEELRRRSASRLLGSGPTHLTDAELWVPPDVWQDVCRRVTAAMTDLHAAAARPRTPGAVRTSSTVSMFLMRDDVAVEGKS